MSAPKHLLRWKGRQSGPFAPEEIRARLKSSEIGLMHEVQMDGQWMSVEKFLAQTAPRPAAPPAPKPEKKAPAPQVKIEEPKPVPPKPIPLPPLTATMPAEQSLFFTAAAPREPAAEAQSGEMLAYAGFWLRGVAAIFDGAILGAFAWALRAIALAVAGETRAQLPAWLLLLVPILSVFGGWLYFALMESSEIQASLGKLAVGLIVTDLDGGRITFSHASGRYFGKIVSALTAGAGYFMAAFTGRKQALHDLVAGCHVLLRLPPSRIFEP